MTFTFKTEKKMRDFLQHYILIYMGIASLIAFVLYGVDKRKARKGRWRIPEKTLLGICLLGGFAGGFLGMQLFHHKTKHWYFYAVVIVSAVIWAAVLYAVFIGKFSF